MRAGNRFLGATRTNPPPIRKSLQNNSTNRKGAGRRHLARTRDGDLAVSHTRYAVNALPKILRRRSQHEKKQSAKEGRYSGHFRVYNLLGYGLHNQDWFPGTFPSAYIYTLLNTPFKDSLRVCTINTTATACTHTRCHTLYCARNRPHT